MTDRPLRNWVAECVDSQESDSGNVVRRGAFGITLAGMSAALAGCRFLGPDASPSLVSVEGVVREQTVVTVEFPENAELPDPGGVDASISFERATSTLDATVRKQNGRRYVLEAPGTVLSGTPSVTVDVSTDAGDWSLSGTAAIAPRPFASAVFLGFDYGHDYAIDGGYLQVDRVAELLGASEDRSSLSAADGAIRGLAGRIGLDAPGERDRRALVAELAALQRAQVERADVPAAVDGRVSAYVPRRFDRGVVAVREANRPYDGTLTPALVLVQGESSGPSVEVSVTPAQVGEGTTTTARPDEEAVATASYEWGVTAPGAYGVLGFEPLELPSDPAIAAALDVVPAYRDRSGFAARIDLRRDFRSFPVAAAFSDRFETGETGYDPEQWARRTSNGGITRQAGGDRLRFAAHPLSHVALATTHRFEPPIRLRVGFGAVATASESPLLVGWFDPGSYLDDGPRVTPRRFARNAVCVEFDASDVRLTNLADSPLVDEAGDEWAGVTYTSTDRADLDWGDHDARTVSLTWRTDRVTLAVDGETVVAHDENLPNGAFPLCLVAAETGGRDASVAFLDHVEVSSPG